MVVPMADPPGVVRNQQGRVEQVADDVVYAPPVRKGAVPAVVAEHEERPEEGALREREDGDQPQRVDLEREGIEDREAAEIAAQGRQRTQRRGTQALGRQRCA
jgi:hypothetical protein